MCCSIELLLRNRIERIPNQGNRPPQRWDVSSIWHMGQSPNRSCVMKLKWANCLCSCLFLMLPLGASAKDKPVITIEVLGSQGSVVARNYVIPGRAGSAQTNCNTNGSAYGTATGYGNTVNSNVNGSSTTNCTTTSTAATPATVGTRYISQENISAKLPDGRVANLWCQQGFRKCASLEPGSYQAQIDGNSLFVIAHDLSGKEKRVKYKVMGLQ